MARTEGGCEYNPREFKGGTPEKKRRGRGEVLSRQSRLGEGAKRLIEAYAGDSRPLPEREGKRRCLDKERSSKVGKRNKEKREVWREQSTGSDPHIWREGRIGPSHEAKEKKCGIQGRRREEKEMEKEGAIKSFPYLKSESGRRGIGRTSLGKRKTASESL